MKYVIFMSPAISKYRYIFPETVKYRTVVFGIWSSHELEEQLISISDLFVRVVFVLWTALIWEQAPVRTSFHD